MNLFRSSRNLAWIAILSVLAVGCGQWSAMERPNANLSAASSTAPSNGLDIRSAFLQGLTGEDKR